jgi:hypothetical protein
MTKVYLVWTSYEDVEAAFYDERDAELWIEEYIREHPTYGGYRPREKGDFGITEVEVK